MARKKVVKKPNLKFIEKLKATLRAEPKAYNQSRFAPNHQLVETDEGMRFVAPKIIGNLCNTPVCMAGHGFLLAGHTVQQLVDAEASDVVAIATEAMGLSSAFTYSLFGLAEDWPAPFAFDADKILKKKQVEKACAYLDAVVLVAQLMADHPFLVDVVGDVANHSYLD